MTFDEKQSVLKIHSMHSEFCTDGIDLCVLWRIVSLINLKMKRMLAFEKRYLRRNSSSVISSCHGLLFLSRFFFIPLSS